jgi:GT2 family glycosyltransferase
MMFTRAGYDIWYEPACTIFHKESQSTGQESPIKTYYLTRNRLLFVKRNKHRLDQVISYAYLVLIVATRDIIKYVIQGRMDLARAVIKGTYSKR